MIKLLHIELMKLLPYRSFKILFLVYLFLQIGFLFTRNSVIETGEDSMSEMFNVFSFPNLWNYYLYFACIFNIILAILIIFITTNEYSYKTIRQNVIDGQSRNQIVLSKISVLLLFTVLSTILVAIAGSIAGSIKAGSINFSLLSERSSLLYAYAIQCLGILSMAYFFATVFKRSGVATLVFLLFIFPLDLVINQAIFKGAINDYMPVSTYFVNLIHSPYNMIRSMGEEAQTGPELIPVVAGIFYILFFLGSTWVVIKKRDL